MKWLMYALVTLLLSVAFALFAKPDPGYILIGYGNYSIEMTLTMLLAGLFISYFLLRFLSGLLHTPGKVKNWNDGRIVRKDLKRLNKGMSQLIEGNAGSAERDLRILASKNGKPLITYLAAARAAQQQGAIERRDEYLALAYQEIPNAQLAIDLSRAEMQISHGEYLAAETNLLELRKQSPQHSQILKMLVSIYRQTGNWQSLYELLPDVRRHKLLDEEEIQQLSFNALQAVMQTADLTTLQDTWKSLSRSDQKNTHLSIMYAENLLRTGAFEEAEELIASALKIRWDSRLAELFGYLQQGDAAKQLAQAESWLLKHPGDPYLLLTNARLSLRNQLWGKARSYIDACLSIEPLAEAYQLLGMLSEKTHDDALALEAYRKGMHLLTGESANTLDVIEGRAVRLTDDIKDKSAQK